MPGPSRSTSAMQGLMVAGSTPLGAYLRSFWWWVLAFNNWARARLIKRPQYLTSPGVASFMERGGVVVWFALPRSQMGLEQRTPPEITVGRRESGSFGKVSPPWQASNMRLGALAPIGARNLCKLHVASCCVKRTPWLVVRRSWRSNPLQRSRPRNASGGWRGSAPSRRPSPSAGSAADDGHRARRTHAAARRA